MLLLAPRGGIRTAMITGDYHQTAISVAWAVGMVPPGGIVHVIDKLTLPTAAVISPPPSPVQLASSNMLFPRSADTKAAYSRWPSTARSNLGLQSPQDSQPQQEPTTPKGGRSHFKSSVLVQQSAPSNTNAVQAGQLLQGLQQDQRSGLANFLSPVVRQATLPLLQLPHLFDHVLSSDETTGKSQSTGPEHFRLQCEGLKFTLGFGDVREDAEAIKALTSIAEGQAQCCITGAAFEHLLQQEDLAVLQAVLQNAVVFARMRPHQKAQVLNLLGGAGIHQSFRGRHRHIPVSNLGCNLQKQNNPVVSNSVASAQDKAGNWASRRETWSNTGVVQCSLILPSCKACYPCNVWPCLSKLS